MREDEMGPFLFGHGMQGLGLKERQKGIVVVDGQDINRAASWHSRLGRSMEGRGVSSFSHQSMHIRMAALSMLEMKAGDCSVIAPVDLPPRRRIGPHGTFDCLR